MTGEEIEFQKHWSHISGRFAERKEIIEYIKKLAGNHFINDETELAHKFRMLAKQLQSDGKLVEEELNKCIERAKVSA